LGDTVKFTVRLKPGAKRNSIEVREDKTLSISVTSRPVSGKANEHVIKLLSKTLRIPKSSCKIVQGERSRVKVIAIYGVEKNEIYLKLK
jgi:uncharacterized protein (TIGR00251 family)